MNDANSKRVLRYNLLVNTVDGGFFGLALGFASFVTIIPLFVSTLTDSAILIGLIPAVHTMGWQLPQILTARSIARVKRIKPMVMWMTLQERIPFLGMALVAFLLPSIGKNATLILTYLLLIWQSIGAGFAANPWQNMVAKLIPSDMRGTFLGMQSSAANLLASLSAVLAGFILERIGAPLDYVYCFLLASLALVISFFFLSLTKEEESQTPVESIPTQSIWKDIRFILKSDAGFRRFIFARSLLAFATLAFAFYAVYAVRHHNVSEATIGIMTGVLMGSQIAANPILGWLGDRLGHYILLEAGILACIASVGIAWWAPHPNWFYLVFALMGISNVTVWTVGLAMTMEFGNETQRPTYIGLLNTLVAPSTIIAPFIGGWMADRWGYPVTFGFSIFCGLVTLVVFFRGRRKVKLAAY
jgi:MFS family permease